MVSRQVGAEFWEEVRSTKNAGGLYVMTIFIGPERYVFGEKKSARKKDQSGREEKNASGISGGASIHRDSLCFGDRKMIMGKTFPFSWNR